ncbi:MAG: hypothetical protein AAGC64_04615 [Bacteroidota bacterium]
MSESSSPKLFDRLLKEMEKDEKAFEILDLWLNTISKDDLSYDEYSEHSAVWMEKLEEYADRHGEDSLLMRTFFSQMLRSTIEKEIFFVKNIKSVKSNKCMYLSAILPRSVRAEFNADIDSLVSDMRETGNSKIYIGIIVVLNIVSVIYHAVFFKLSGYFYPKGQQTGNN